MDLYSLVTNIRSAELIFNLALQVIAVSLIGWTVMKIWRPLSAPARSAGYLAILVSLAILPVISTMFNLNRITWFQSTIELPQSYTRQSSPDNFQERQKFLEEKNIINNEKPVIRQDTFNKNENFDPETVLETGHQKGEGAPGNEQQENLRHSDKNNIPFVTGDLILLSANIFGMIWLAGFIVFILRLGFKLSFLKGYMYNLNTGDTERLKNIYNSIKHVFKDKPIPDIYFSSSLSSPVTIGILQPVMILPVEMENVSDDDLKSILLHELAHIFHSDNFIGFLQHLLSAGFWWNPLVYYLNSAYSDSREDVCDNYAINVLKSPQKYANILLSLAEKTHFMSHMPATTGMSLSRRSFEHRVLDLLRTDRDLSTIFKPSLIILSLIVAIVITSCGTGMKLSFMDADYPDNTEYLEISKKPVWVTGRDIINKINAGEFEDVEKYMDNLVTQKPYTVDGTRVLEDLYTFVGDRFENSEMLDKWCAKEPPHHSSLILRGNYYINQAWKYRGTGFGYTITEEGRKKFNEYLELAKKDFEKAYSMNPTDPNSAASMITVCNGLNMGEGDMETWFNRSIEADPVSYKAWSKKQNYLRPKWHGTPEKDKAFAEYCYNNAPEKSVIHEIMLDYIIEEYQRSGSKADYYNDPSITKTIDSVVNKTLENFPDSTSIRRKLAQIDAITQNYEKAVSLYNEILATDPGNPDALRLRGNLYSHPSFQNFDLAESDIKKSIESDPDGPNSYEVLARMARINGDYKKAIEYFTIAIKSKPKEPQFYVERGMIKGNFLRDYTSALEDFKESLKLDTLSIPANLNMAICLENMQQYDEAKKYCMKALDILETRKQGNAYSLTPALAENFKKTLDSILQRLNGTPTQLPRPKMKSMGDAYPVLGGNLSQYTGTYELNPDTNVMIRLLNGRLMLRLTGQPVIALTQESDVIFFHRILKTGVEFFKDQSGNITHLMLTQNGIEKKAVRTSDKVIDKNAVTLTADTLSQYVGTYKMPTLDLMITMEGNQLFAQFPGLMLKVLFPESETLFFDNIIDTRLEFFKDKSGKVTHLVFTQGNVGITAPRVEKATVSIPDNYGLTEKTAIKTGGGPKGEHEYLDMLCGPNGEKIKFKRLGSCCAFETTNSPFGNTGLLDKYEVIYDGLKERVIVYLNMYDPPTGKFSTPFGLKMRN